MPVFSHDAFDGHEQVVFCRDAESGLKAIIAIHNTSRGTSLGGCRMWPYANEEEALTDVLRLSRGMTYKSALADLPFGGGKSVIIGNPQTDKTPALFHAMGRFVESLSGRYVVAEDVGISVPDVETMSKETRHVAGITAGGSGDPSPATAFGVFEGIKAAVAFKLGAPDLKGIRVAVQGLGHVGWELCRLLHEAGAQLIVADLNRQQTQRAVEWFDAQVSAPDAIIREAVSVYAPCALGATINDASIGELRCAIVAGSANNQLAEERHGALLRDRGILYAPDYVINAGGVINISHEKRLTGDKPYVKATAFAHVARIGNTLTEIFEIAERKGISTAQAADRLAEQRFKRAGHRKAA